MTAKIIDGRAIALSLREQIKEKVRTFSSSPCIAFILVGEHPASQIYVRNKIKACEETGIETKALYLEEDITQTALLGVINALNKDETVHGILVQLPLPDHIHLHAVLSSIEPQKDVDGFHPLNTGKLTSGMGGGFIPCTPKGILKLIYHTKGTDLSGLHAVVIGRSNIVGRPMAELLLHQNCTVTVCHHLTKNITEHTTRADILIVATGVPHLVKKDWVKDDVMIIDVGINRLKSSDGTSVLVGDVDFDQVKNVAGHITPVPGGVGPMTIACLLENTVEAFEKQQV